MTNAAVLATLTKKYGFKPTDRPGEVCRRKIYVQTYANAVCFVFGEGRYRSLAGIAMSGTGIHVREVYDEKQLKDLLEKIRCLKRGKGE